MSVEQLVANYLRLKQELTVAFLSEPWKSCRSGHIQRLSVELGSIEDQLQARGIRDDVFVALISGTAQLVDIS